MSEAEKTPADVDYKVDLGAGPVQREEVQETQEEATAETAEVQEQEEQLTQPTEEPQASEEVEGEAPKEKSKEELFNELLRDRYDIDNDELQNVLTNKDKTRELPEDVQKYLDYRKETNRGLDDYLKLQQDFSEINSSDLLREYYKQTKQGLEESDIDSLIDIKFGYDEGADENLIKAKTLDMKEEVYKARQFFEAQKDKYRAPLESSDTSSFEEQKEAVEFYKLYKDEQTKKLKSQESVRKVFEEKTSRLFNDEFKGFEFKIGEEKVVFKPNDLSKVKDTQSDLNNFISKHTDEKGALVDAEKYHKALSMAMNPEAYAKFFYEQGKASAINSVVSEGKNIDMNVRSQVDSSKPKAKFRVVDDSPYMSGLKIKKR
jgi:hypothetical protein